MELCVQKIPALISYYTSLVPSAEIMRCQYQQRVIYGPPKWMPFKFCTSCFSALVIHFLKGAHYRSFHLSGLNHLPLVFFFSLKLLSFRTTYNFRIYFSGALTSRSLLWRCMNFLVGDLHGVLFFLRSPTFPFLPPQSSPQKTPLPPWSL